MTEQCCAANNQVMILACSGGSNVGQLSNQAAVELTQEGKGKMFCLAGIGGGLSGFVQSAKDVDQMVLIDGCEVACGKKSLELANVPVTNYIVITELGITKNKDFALRSEDIATVKQEVYRLCEVGRDAASDAQSQTTETGCCR